MSNEPDRPVSKPALKKTPFSRKASGGSGGGILRQLFSAVTHNWAIKAACVLLALLLWGIVLSQDATLTRGKTFNDVPIAVSRSSLLTLRASGFVIVDGLDDLPTLRLRADVPQRNYNNVTADNFSVRLDLTKIKSAGEQMVPVTYTSSTSYGAVVDISVKEVLVTVDEYFTRYRIPVSVASFGDEPEGFYLDSPRADPAIVAISGPRKLVSTVRRCEAQFDMGLLTPVADIQYNAVPFLLYDAQNQVVDSANIIVTVTGQATDVDSIIVEQNLYPEISLQLSHTNIVKGQPAQGYEIKQITISPQGVIIAGDDLTIDAGDWMYLSGAVDVSGATESVTRSLPINKPANIKYISTDIAYVTVEIGPVSEEAP